MRIILEDTTNNARMMIDNVRYMFLFDTNGGSKLMLRYGKHFESMEIHILINGDFLLKNAKFQKLTLMK